MAQPQGTQRPGNKVLWDLLHVSHPSPWIRLGVLVHFQFLETAILTAAHFAIGHQDLVK